MLFAATRTLTPRRATALVRCAGVFECLLLLSHGNMKMHFQVLFPYGLLRKAAPQLACTPA